MIDRPSIELITEAQKLWSLRRQGLLTPDEHEVELFALERQYGLDVTPCPNCKRRRATPEGQGGPLCHRCREFGDAVDRAWAEYNDHREQVGGAGL